MSELEANFDPYSKQELFSLLPNRCGECKFARFVVALERINETGFGGPMERIRDIEQRCSGHEGSDRYSPMYSKAVDRSGCPYTDIMAEEGGSYTRTD